MVTIYLLSILELKKENFLKGKKVSYENWEKKVEQIALTIVDSIQRFYLRKSLVYEDILNSIVVRRDWHIPEADLKGSNKYMEEVALSNYIFATLPATTPSQHWPLHIRDLNTRLQQLKPTALCSEPFDNNFLFQNQAMDFIHNNLKIYQQLLNVSSVFSYF
jgi:hypothetical protein